ncbi:MAG: hypothetical protein IJ960_03660 [Oscillospiraceae bacterium]|nr:hypothetical protein [Oscillospiraceae bacterium]
MKKICLIVLTLALLLTMSACGCKHETWNEADCVTPKTCAECGETEGEALGHVWMAATCDAPKTCERCALTEGEALGHSWTEADCENPKTCSTCKLTEGDALGHDWQDATTEAPKTCSICAKTEGERIVTDPRFTTANNQQLFGIWRAEMSEYVPDFDMELTMYLTMEFRNDGTMKMSMELKDPDAFLQVMIDLSVEATYAGLEAEGYTREEADALILETYGMSIQEYMSENLSGMDMNQVLGVMDALTYVYYAEGDLIYSGTNWNLELIGEKYSIEDGVLYMFQEGVVEPTAFQRVEEPQE